MREHGARQREEWPGHCRAVAATAGFDEPSILARFAGIGPDDRVLDVGCGTGRILAGIRTLAGKVIGVDFLPEAVLAARAAGVPAVLASGFALPFATGTFDCVICNDVLHNVPTELSAALVKELLRVTSGRVLIGDVRNRVATVADVASAWRGLRRGARLDGTS